MVFIDPGQELIHRFAEPGQCASFFVFAHRRTYSFFPFAEIVPAFSNEERIEQFAKRGIP